MYVSWIFCFTFLLLKHTVSVQHVPVEGFIGKSVNLTCSLGPKQTTVFWRYNDSRTVCDISDGEARCKDQDPVYKDRVKITNGNFSIMLSNLTETDAGLYTCNSNSLPEQILELTVKAANEFCDVVPSVSKKQNVSDKIPSSAVQSA